MSTVSAFPQRPDVADVVGGEIRAWMGRRRVNQSQLAQALGMTQSAVSKRLNGHIAFDIKELDRIAEFLGIEVAELFGAPPGQRPPPPDGGLSSQTADAEQRLADLAASKRTRGAPTRTYEHAA